MSKAGKLLREINAKHEWRNGRMRGGSGTELSQTDVCMVCGLKRNWFEDQQDGIAGSFTFFTAAGKELPLREAADLEC